MPRTAPRSDSPGRPYKIDASSLMIWAEVGGVGFIMTQTVLVIPLQLNFKTEGSDGSLGCIGIRRDEPLKADV